MQGFLYQGELYRFAVADSDGLFVARFQTEAAAAEFARAFTTKWETEALVLDAATQRFEVFVPAP